MDGPVGVSRLCISPAAYPRRHHGFERHHRAQDTVDVSAAYDVSAEIHAPPENVWAILTRAEGMTDWNSTLTSLEGDIELGGTVRMQVPEAPGRTFTVKVTRFVPSRRWCGTKVIR